MLYYVHSVLVQALFFSPLQLLQMETTTCIARGTITGTAIASTAVAAAAGTATVSPFGAVGTFGAGAIGATAGVVVAALVALPAFTVGAVVGRCGAGITKLIGVW